MKHTAVRTLLAALAMLILAGGCAFAQVQAELSAHIFTGMLTIEVSGLEAGEEYVLLVFPEDENPESPALDNLLLIDQLTAASGGTLMLGIQNAEPCIVMLGGRFEEDDSPLVLGSYSGDEAPSNVLNTPAQLKEIREEAFMGSAFNYVYISENTTAIGPRAFMNCAGLCGVYIPESVVEIGEDAFSGCDRLVIVCAENSAAHLYAAEYGIEYSFGK